VLRDVSSVDTSVSFLGHALRMPVILAPIGSMQHLSPDGGISFAKAAAEFGTVMTMSLMSPPSIEDVAAATGAPKILQLYVQGDDAWVASILQRTEAAGYAAICLTVDSPYHGRHDRQLLNPFPARRPAVHRDGPNYLASVTWATLDRIRAMTGLPFMLKGVMTGEDAALAVEHGVDHVWLSNHGGRQLDCAQGAIDVLSEVVEAVNGRAGVIFDSGVLRGTDVVKALALGADVVAIGRLAGWGMAAGGADGLVRTLEILENELVSAMGLLGVRCVDELDASYVTRAEPVTPPHEMSAWVSLAEHRIV
jgi:isopentenyl diphosphate isomerase/L-lactate dehydrogenase-like FMN-dependent dehydrogenase